tara:strand:+ start:181 stop:516 length:336 start_codon:yes stop_codon:yes gene_type:complete
MNIYLYIHTYKYIYRHIDIDIGHIYEKISFLHSQYCSHFYYTLIKLTLPRQAVNALIQSTQEDSSKGKELLGDADRMQVLRDLLNPSCPQLLKLTRGKNSDSDRSKGTYNH